MKQPHSQLLGLKIKDLETEVRSPMIHMTVQTMNQVSLPNYMIVSMPRFHNINIQKKSLLNTVVMPSSLTLLFNIKYT
jgi:hypothetical protein